MLERLKRLEGVVQTLGAHIEEDGTVTQIVPVEEQRPQRLPQSMSSTATTMNGTSTPDGTLGLGKDLGRLVIEEGRSRYVNSNYWASLSNEVCIVQHEEHRWPPAPGLFD